LKIYSSDYREITESLLRVHLSPFGMIAIVILTETVFATEIADVTMIAVAIAAATATDAVSAIATKD
jgi:hypothetical protein